MTDYRDIADRVWRGQRIPRNEVDALLNWLLTPKGRADFEHDVASEWGNFVAVAGDEVAPPVVENILKKIHNRINAAKRRKRRRMWVSVAAAAAVVVAVVGVRILDTPVSYDTPPPQQQTGIALTLSDGSVVSVERLAGGRLGDARVLTGAIEYVAAEQDAPANPNVQHTLNIPQGRDFRLALSDGSEVWLNGGAQLRYPVRFGDGQRRVELLCGEAYFDVHADPAHPFVVESHGQEISALGTRFNVAGERIVTTTLAEGLVRITANGGQTVLTPGHQAIFDTETRLTRQRLVDAEEVMAWRTGYIVIENQTLEQVLEKIGAWWGVEWTIAPDVPRGMEFRGKIRRLELEPTLRRLAHVSGLHIRLSNDKIIVTK